MNTEDYLSKSRVHLNSSGFSYDESYYSLMNSSVQAVEVSYFTGKNSLSLPSVQLSAS